MTERHVAICRCSDEDQTTDINERWSPRRGDHEPLLAHGVASSKPSKHFKWNGWPIFKSRISYLNWCSLLRKCNSWLNVKLSIFGGRSWVLHESLQSRMDWGKNFMNIVRKRLVITPWTPKSHWKRNQKNLQQSKQFEAQSSRQSGY